MIPCNRSSLKTGFCVFWLFLMIFLLGSSLFIITIGIQDKRSQLLQQYDQDIQTWTQKMPQFEDLFITVKINQDQEQDYLQLLPNYKDEQILTADQYSTLPNYKGFFFQHSISAYLVGVNDTQKFNTKILISFNLKVTSQNKTSQIQIPQIIELKKQVLQGLLPSACQQEKGYYDIKTADCQTFWKLTGICVKIHKIQEKWMLDSTGGKVGCHGNFNDRGIFTQVEASTQQARPDKLPVIFDQFTIKVRSGFDPLVKARILTDGTLDFQLPASGWEAMGVSLLILSGFLVFQPILYLYKKFTGSSDNPPRLVEFKRFDTQQDSKSE